MRVERKLRAARAESQCRQILEQAGWIVHHAGFTSVPGNARSDDLEAIQGKSQGEPKQLALAAR